eukprot:6214037-Pleurochrysis_carterae.AAC.2
MHINQPTCDAHQPRFCVLAHAHCRTAARLDGANLDRGTLDVHKEERRHFVTRRGLNEKIGIAMTRVHYEMSSPSRCRGPAELTSACAIHALSALLSANACCMLHTKHTACVRPDVTDVQAHLPMRRMCPQVNTHKCAGAPPSVLALRRCARAHCKLKAFRRSCG